MYKNTMFLFSNIHACVLLLPGRCPLVLLTTHLCYELCTIYMLYMRIVFRARPRNMIGLCVRSMNYAVLMTLGGTMWHILLDVNR